MSIGTFSFKDLLDLFFSRDPRGALTSAALIALWQGQEKNNELTHLLVSNGIDVADFAAALKVIIEDAGTAVDAWLLQYIAGKNDLDAISALEFLRDCITSEDHPLYPLFKKLEFTAELITIDTRRKVCAPEFALLQENAARSPVHLTRYGRDLIACAQRDEFPNLVRREEVFQQLLGALRKKRRGNVIITGPAGAGKTALVECFANELVSGKLADAFPHYRLFEIHVGKLIAGTQYRGMFEERLEQVTVEALELSPVILFIDEIHLILGAGRTSESAMDASNILKPPLARGDIQIIGATTPQEYQRYIQSDPALARRFEELRLSEPDAETTYAMVRHQLRWLAGKHCVSFEDGCIAEAIRLTNRYQPNRKQPDKAIDLLDSVAGVATLKGQMQIFSKDLRQAMNVTEDKEISSPAVIADKIRGLTEGLSQGIFGQREAVERVSRTLVLSQLRGGEKARPISLMFAGSSGVGKTSLAKAIASSYFGNAEQYLHLNMGDYNTPFSVSRILGSPGPAGRREQGQLIEFLQTYQRGVLLFDEVEKGHPHILDMMLGMLDNDFMTTEAGDRMCANGCIIVVTTNTLKPKDLEKSPIGFSTSSAGSNPLEMLSQHFRPEFLNRFDEILLFRDIEKDALVQIIRKELEAYRALIDETELEELIGNILGQLGGYQNARAAKRATRKAMENILASPPSHRRAM